MADARSVSPAISTQTSVGTDACPRVADLITYALGQCAADERQRVESHLQDGNCCQCRGWVEQAMRFRTDAWPDLAALPARSTTSHPTNDQTPIPPSSKWQRQAFQDLEERLRALDENQR